MSREVVVGYDETSASREAVEWAAVEAMARGARLRIVMCYSVTAAAAATQGLMIDSYSVLLSHCADRLASLRSVVLAEHPGLDVVVEPSAGPAGTVLTARSRTSELLVVGASSHSGAKAFWLGSTARELVRRSSCPIVVVRGAASRGIPDRIVVGIDGSPASGQALDWAGDEAQRHGRELLVVHAWSYPYLPINAESERGHDMTRIDAAITLERSVQRVRERNGVAVDGQLVEDSPVSALLEAVRDGDLLVLGSRGRGALKSAVFGSTVNSVVEEAVVPIVVVRSSDGAVPRPTVPVDTPATA